MVHYVHPNGDLSVPRRVKGDDGLVGDGLERLEKGSEQWREWVDYAERTGDQPIELAEAELFPGENWCATDSPEEIENLEGG